MDRTVLYDGLARMPITLAEVCSITAEKSTNIKLLREAILIWKMLVNAYRRPEYIPDGTPLGSLITAALPRQ